MLDEPALPRRSLDTILPGLTFSVIGDLREQPAAGPGDPLTKAPPAGGPVGWGGWRELPWCVPGQAWGQPGPASRGRGPFQLGLPGAPGSRCWVTPPPPSGHLLLPGVSSIWQRVLGAVQSHPPTAFGGFRLLGKGPEGHQLGGERSPRNRRGVAAAAQGLPRQVSVCALSAWGGGGERVALKSGGAHWPSFAPP